VSIVTIKPKKPYWRTLEFRERVYKSAWRVLLYAILAALILFSVYVIDFTIVSDPLFLWLSHPITSFTFLILGFVVLDKLKRIKGFLRVLLVVTINLAFIAALYSWVTIPAYHRMPSDEVLAAASNVCSGKPAHSASYYNYGEIGIHPIVLIADFDENFESSDNMPFFWKPGYVESMQTVACVNHADSPDRYTFAVFEARTGRVLDEFNLTDISGEISTGMNADFLEFALRRDADPRRYGFDPDSKYEDGYYDPYVKDKGSGPFFAGILDTLACHMIEYVKSNTKS
jgi:hypothetical protein